VYDDCFAIEINTMPSAKEVADCFVIYANQDGMLPVEDLGTCLRALGWNPSEVEVQAYINTADSDGTGTIPFDLFKEVVAQQEQVPPVTKEQLKEAFHVFDKDGKGAIPTAELEFMITKLGEALSPEECAAMIKAVDADGSGTIDLEEFASMM
jgi:calmodulin